MPNQLAIHSFAQSLLSFLQQSHAVFAPALPAASFEVLSSGRFSSATEAIADGTVTLFLHRIAINNQLRNMRVGPPMGSLGLDLHFLLTVWSTDVKTELVLLGWAMRELHYHAFLDSSSLSSDAEWDPDEVITIVPAEINPEELARIWEASQRGYRLSFPFIARIVRLGVDQPQTGRPAVATRFTFTDNLEETEP